MIEYNTDNKKINERKLGQNYRDEYTPTNVNITKALAITDAEFNIISASGNFSRFFGQRFEYDCLYNIIPDKNFAERLQQRINEVYSIGYLYFSTKMRRLDGALRDITLRITLLPDDTEQSGKYLVEFMDMQNFMNYMSSLEIDNAKYRTMLETIGCKCFEYNSVTGIFKIFRIKGSLEEVLYTADKRHVGQINFNITSTDRERLALFRRSLETGESYLDYSFSTNPFVLNKNATHTDSDDTASCHIKGITVVTGDNRFITSGCIFDGHKFIDTISSNLSSLDMMTGLLDKKAILDIARSAVNDKKYEQVFLIMLDLDNFKMVNDTYGHMLGDKVIKRVANIIKADVRQHGWVGRFGGDEYFAVLCNLGGEGDLRNILYSISKHIEDCYKERFEGFNLSCSIGASEYPRNGTDFDLLFKKADRGLYIAKKKGRRRYIIYKEELHGEIDLDSTNDDYIESLDTQKFAGDVARYTIMRDGICELLTRGMPAVNDFCKRVISSYCLTGISIYSGKEFKLYRRWGNYSKPMLNADYMNSRQALARFNDKDIFWENHLQSNNFYVATLHTKLLNHNIHSTVQCIVRNGKDIKCLVTYDMEMPTRNWTEEDINYFGIISNIICALLSQ